MRKLTVELKVKEEFTKMLDFLLDKTESIELIELIKIDFKQEIKMGIVAINLKKGYTIEDINLPEFMEMLTVLKKEGNRYIVFSKVKFFKKFSAFAQKFNIDIIWDTPTIFKKGIMVISVIGNEENLKKFLNVIKTLGETKKQKEILIAAKNSGYYSYPRKINTQELSDKVGLSKPTVVQHLRKAEIRIISNILTGY